jgi:YggT family protein
MIALINFVAMVVGLYIWVIIISAVFSWLIAFGVVNTHNQFVYTIVNTLYRLTEPALRPIRQIMPDLGGIDVSPIVLILLLIFLRDVVLYGWIAPLFVPAAQTWGG